MKMNLIFIIDDYTSTHTEKCLIIDLNINIRIEGSIWVSDTISSVIKYSAI